MSLTLAEANVIVDAAIAKAKEPKVGMAVAVCDEGGRLISFKRIEGTIWVSVYGAQGKAVTSSALGRPSIQVQEIAGSPTFAALSGLEGGHMVPAQGGGGGRLPVFRGGVLIGSVGASGGTGDEDEICAQAGIDAL